jgi:hypothetical protein
MADKGGLVAVRGLLERIRRGAMPGGPLECGGTWLRQTGEIRMATDRPWLPFEAQEWFEGAGLDCHPSAAFYIHVENFDSPLVSPRRATHGSRPYTYNRICQ